jgi:hypothetical protein
MNGNLLQVAVPIIGLVSGLIATYVSLQNRALVAEVRKEIAEMEGRLFLRIDGTFVRLAECRLRSEGIQRQFASMVEEVSSKAAATLLRDESVQSRITKLVEEGMRTIAGLLREEIVLQKIATLAADARVRGDKDAAGGD